MNDHDVEVTLTPERIKLYERAMVIGLPAIVVAMYGDRIQKLIDDEREACAALIESRKTGADNLMDAVRDMEAKAIRARGQE
jgi:hypothetical protein